jgi:hypothetical protein
MLMLMLMVMVMLMMMMMLLLMMVMMMMMHNKSNKKNIISLSWQLIFGTILYTCFDGKQINLFSP